VGHIFGGKFMRWFKHYSDAEFSESLSKLEAKFGFEGLGRYWRFVEFLNRQFDGVDVCFTIESSKIRQLLRFRSLNDWRSFADQLAIIRGLKLDHSGNVCEIKAPILLELQGRDFKKARQGRAKTAPKRKNRLDKDKEEDKEVPATTLPALAKLWNLYSNNLPKVKASNYKRKKAADLRLKEFGEENWIKAITRVAISDFCNGLNDRSWVATFDWILQPDSYLKITEGKYDNRLCLSKKQIQNAKNTQELAAWVNDDTEGGKIEFK
jgi:hypothetical protein